MMRGDPRKRAKRRGMASPFRSIFVTVALAAAALLPAAVTGPSAGTVRVAAGRARHRVAGGRAAARPALGRSRFAARGPRLAGRRAADAGAAADDSARLERHRQDACERAARGRRRGSGRGRRADRNVVPLRLALRDAGQDRTRARARTHDVPRHARSQRRRPRRRRCPLGRGDERRHDQRLHAFLLRRAGRSARLDAAHRSRPHAAPAALGRRLESRARRGARRDRARPERPGFEVVLCGAPRRLAHVAVRADGAGREARRAARDRRRPAPLSPDVVRAEQRDPRGHRRRESRRRVRSRREILRRHCGQAAPGPAPGAGPRRGNRGAGCGRVPTFRTPPSNSRIKFPATCSTAPPRHNCSPRSSATNARPSFPRSSRAA